MAYSCSTRGKKTLRHKYYHELDELNIVLSFYQIPYVNVYINAHVRANIKSHVKINCNTFLLTKQN